ncbi:MAG TPA: biotin/lipoyl-containing protein, partial [Ilumatobacteraceae bacterium]
CERYVQRGRHIEVQVFGDVHGTVVALHERECSLQRRHQKVVEEAPSPAVDSALRTQLCAAAVTAAREVGYVGAGTVEMLLDEHGAFFFLEMNTRLQVEHPVTEAITGLDLVELQLAVAEGRPLPDEALQPPMRGHAVEVRLTAEDPGAGYRPSTGTFHTFDIPSSVRVDSGFASGSTVSPHYDSLLAKLIAHGPTREAAIRALGGALRDARLHGPVTNRDQLRRILSHPEVVAGHLHTGFLDEHPCTEPFEVSPASAVAAALAIQARHRASARVLAGVASGWRNNPAVDSHVQLEHDGTVVTVAYDLGRNGHLAVDGEPIDAHVVSVTPCDVVLEQRGVRATYRVEIADGHVFVDGPDGSVTFRAVERFPVPGDAAHAGSLVAPMPGSILRVHVRAGDHVVAGQPLVALEAMKMEHVVHAPIDGLVAEVLVTSGEQVDTGQALLVVESAATEAIDA